MPHVSRHLLLRCNSHAPSEVVVALRNGGYTVTNAVTDDLALQIVAAGQVDGIIIELPSLNAWVFARRLERSAEQTPALVVSTRPGMIRRSIGLRIVSAQDPAEDLIRAVDRMLADHETPRHRAVHE